MNPFLLEKTYTTYNQISILCDMPAIQKRYTETEFKYDIDDLVDLTNQHELIAFATDQRADEYRAVIQSADAPIPNDLIFDEPIFCGMITTTGQLILCGWEDYTSGCFSDEALITDGVPVTIPAGSYSVTVYLEAEKEDDEVDNWEDEPPLLTNLLVLTPVNSLDDTPPFTEIPNSDGVI